MTLEEYPYTYTNDKVFYVDCHEYSEKEEYLDKLEKALKILLEDHNVAYVRGGMNPTID